MLSVQYPDKPSLSALTVEADSSLVDEFCEKSFAVNCAGGQPTFLVFRELPDGR